MYRMNNVYFCKLSNSEVLKDVDIPENSVEICDGMFNVIEHGLVTLFKVSNNLVSSIDRYPIELFTSNNSLRIKNMQIGDKIDNIVIDSYLVIIGRLEEDLFEMGIYKSNNRNRTFNFMFNLNINREEYIMLAEDVFKYYTKQR